MWSQTWSERDILPVGSNLINSSRDIATDRPISSLSSSSNCSAIPLEKGATLVASRPSDGEVTASVYTINILISSLVLPHEVVSSRWSPRDHLLWGSDTDWKKFGLTFLIPLVATQSKAHVKSIILIKNLQRPYQYHLHMEEDIWKVFSKQCLSVLSLINLGEWTFMWGNNHTVPIPAKICCHFIPSVKRERKWNNQEKKVGIEIQSSPKVCTFNCCSAAQQR